MDDSSCRQNFDLDKKNETHYHSWKEHLKMSKIAKFGCVLTYCCKMRKICPVKFANYNVYICITRGEISIFEPKVVTLNICK